MYDRYSHQLENFAEVDALAAQENQKEEKSKRKQLRARQGKIRKYVAILWKHTFAKLGEDWVFLALLGVIMAILSFIMDRGIAMCNIARLWLYRELNHNTATQFVAWVSLPVCLVLFSAGFSKVVAPQSIGSGIPEMKTILRGVSLKEYLTFRTLVAKVVGLTATLGSGLPIGKEGPFVHIASMSATLLSKLVSSFHGIYENENRAVEMLAAACAVGVASCFAAPVGGVLFSIEVTTVYFAVRNYWRGFFAAVCGATTFRLLAVWFQKAETVTAVFKTNFHMDFPFDPQELFVFALMGIICGIGGALFVWMHRQYVTFMKNNKVFNKFLMKNTYFYSGIVALLVSSLTFPLGTGQFLAGELSGQDQVISLFTNFTWANDNATIEEEEIVAYWKTPWTDVVTNLALYTLFSFIASIACSTMPVPSGIFIPVFKIGAGFGRMMGELMHLWFPSGMRYGGKVSQIIPGGYATVGAAAFSGSVTHTVSVSVIVFEMTGQITHIIPIMIAVLISNAVASFLAPSIYDSIILIKKLPYLPDLLPSGSGMYNIHVEDFMNRDVKYIYHGMSYRQMEYVLKENRGLKNFPLVDKPETMVLLGSIRRLHLIQLMEQQIGKKKRLQIAVIRRRDAELKAFELRSSEEKKKRYSVFYPTPSPSVNQLDQSDDNQITNRSRIRLALEAIFRKSTKDIDNEASQSFDIDATPLRLMPSKKDQSKDQVCDMTLEDQKKWEEEQLNLPVNFSCHIDPAPFQLVEKTSLLKVHYLFSMVGVSHAYVTATGKLVGVVGMKELRNAIEGANSGALPDDNSESYEEETLILDDVKDSSVRLESDASTKLTMEDKGL